MSENKIVRETDYEVRVDGNTIHVTESVWADGRKSFHVALHDEAVDYCIPLTNDEALDAYPTDEQIRILLEPENVEAGYRLVNGS